MNRYLKLLTLTLMITVAGSGFADTTDPAQAFPWRDDYEQAKAEAQSHGLPLMLWFSSESCGYSRQMNEWSFSQQRVIDAVGRRVVPLRIKGGKAMRQQYGITGGTPSTAIIDPGSETLLHRFHGYQSASSILQELDQLDTRIDLQTRSPEAFALLAQADQIYREGDYAGIAEKTTASLAIDDQCAETYRWRAKAYVQLERFPEALADLDRAVELEPNSAVIRFERGLVLHVLGEFDRAANDHRRAQRLIPGNASYIALQGWYALIASDRIVDAQRYADGYLNQHRYNRSEFWAYYLLRHAAGSLSQEELQKWAKRSYQKVQANRVIAMRALAIGDHEIAAQYFAKANQPKFAGLYDYHPLVADQARLKAMSSD